MFLGEMLSKLRNHWRPMVICMAVWLAIGGLFLLLCHAKWEAQGYVKIGKIINNPVESILMAMTRVSDPSTLNVVMQKVKLDNDEYDINNLRGSLQVRKIDERIFLIKLRGIDRALSLKILQYIIEELTRQHKTLMKPSIEYYENTIKQIIDEQQNIKQIYLTKKMTKNPINLWPIESKILYNKSRLLEMKKLLSPLLQSRPGLQCQSTFQIIRYFLACE